MVEEKQARLLQIIDELSADGITPAFTVSEWLTPHGIPHVTVTLHHVSPTWVLHSHTLGAIPVDESVPDEHGQQQLPHSSPGSDFIQKIVAKIEHAATMKQTESLTPLLTSDSDNAGLVAGIRATCA